MSAKDELQHVTQGEVRRRDAHRRRVQLYVQERFAFETARWALRMEAHDPIAAAIAQAVRGDAPNLRSGRIFSST